MKAYLQFANGIGGPYAPCGLIRTSRKVYAVESWQEVNREGDPEHVVYQVEIEETVLQLHGNFLSNDLWHFRLQYPNDGQVVYLGQIPYQIEFDALLNRDGIVYHTIRLRFLSTTIPGSDPFSFDDSVYAGEDAAFG